jgi:hypothetical protein
MGILGGNARARQVAENVINDERKAVFSARDASLKAAAQALSVQQLA